MNAHGLMLLTRPSVARAAALRQRRHPRRHPPAPDARAHSSSPSSGFGPLRPRRHDRSLPSPSSSRSPRTSSSAFARDAPSSAGFRMPASSAFRRPHAAGHRPLVYPRPGLDDRHYRRQGPFGGPATISGTALVGRSSCNSYSSTALRLRATTLAAPVTARRPAASPAISAPHRRFDISRLHRASGSALSKFVFTVAHADFVMEPPDFRARRFAVDRSSADVVKRRFDARTFEPLLRDNLGPLLARRRSIGTVVPGSGSARPARHGRSSSPGSI